MTDISLYNEEIMINDFKWNGFVVLMRLKAACHGSKAIYLNYTAFLLSVNQVFAIV